MTATYSINSRPSRSILIGNVEVGGNSPISMQSMCATKTTDIAATLKQVQLLESAGAHIIRIAVDSKKEVEALREIRKETNANLVVDLQENFRLAADVAPMVQKLRYNPGHLHHHQKEVSVRDKVRFLADVAGQNDCAIRIGVNFGSLDPAQKKSQDDSSTAALSSAAEHCQMLEEIGFTRYLVSLKSSNPLAVVDINKRFAADLPQVPLHLGVTEAGMLPDGALKTRLAFEKLLSIGIGDTVRVSLTLPESEKHKEIEVAKEIIQDILEGRLRASGLSLSSRLDVISCPSCSRVENSAFVELAAKVKAETEYAKDYPISIAVMGCRVNGPGETDDADLGLWCGPNYVNLKRGTESLGAFSYDEVLGELKKELDVLVAKKKNSESKKSNNIK